MNYVIDRFEGPFAVCEDEEGRMKNIEKDLLPSSAREGEVIRWEGQSFCVDQEETAARRERIHRKLMDLL